MIGSHGNLVLKLGVDSLVGVCSFIRQCRLFHRFYRPNNQILFLRTGGASFLNFTLHVNLAVVGLY